MAPMQNSYLLTPLWNLDPSMITLGCVIADVRDPQIFTSNKDLPAEIDTEIHTEEVKNCSGKITYSHQQGIRRIISFIKGIAGSREAYYSMSWEVEYSCESMETLKFTPSPEFIAKVTADIAVKSRLKIGGIGDSKVFVVTGVKIAKGLAITSTKETAQDIFIEFVNSGNIVGLRALIGHTHYEENTHTNDAPIVFALQVEELHLNWKGVGITKAYIGQRADQIGHFVAVADRDLDDENADGFGLESCSGFEEDGKKCRFIIPHA
ncbi:uncharacterized protein TRIVIDRAFT_221368 [Trichoderma virens Gv29-8]|uniref:Uncharacterized protein n=1 Tax=Hypocrea virens (strain Gv29-8 / FGSC 10586) TaxID=413071 RepID=G9MQQ5_HYPVG|nr:uncharacterized protein TRIVIDRAFT_221368 [Trichoderma virens Gv29-8]EHK24122.1 hypothetical protein TRIVIDRAFT_221368 [Trichoderma virens Gv29-8]UKZ50434.1 hypothetical protein TrVGV298_004697 [Trichoderma virens]